MILHLKEWCYILVDLMEWHMQDRSLDFLALGHNSEEVEEEYKKDHLDSYKYDHTRASLLQNGRHRQYFSARFHLVLLDQAALEQLRLVP
jgi:hypothetical protein